MRVEGSLSTDQGRLAGVQRVGMYVKTEGDRLSVFCMRFQPKSQSGEFQKCSRAN